MTSTGVHVINNSDNIFKGFACAQELSTMQCECCQSKFIAWSLLLKAVKLFLPYTFNNYSKTFASFKYFGVLHNHVLFHIVYKDHYLQKWISYVYMYVIDYFPNKLLLYMFNPNYTSVSVFSLGLLWRVQHPTVFFCTPLFTC